MRLSTCLGVAESQGMRDHGPNCADNANPCPIPGKFDSTTWPLLYPPVWRERPPKKDRYTVDCVQLLRARLPAEQDPASVPKGVPADEVMGSQSNSSSLLLDSDSASDVWMPSGLEREKNQG